MLARSCICSDSDFCCMKRSVAVVRVNHDPVSRLNVFDGGCGIALDELGFAVELYCLGHSLAGFNRDRVIGHRSDRPQYVHAAVGEGQRAQKQRAN